MVVRFLNGSEKLEPNFEEWETVISSNILFQTTNVQGDSRKMIPKQWIL